MGAINTGHGFESLTVNMPLYSRVSIQKDTGLNLVTVILMIMQHQKKQQQL